MKQPTYHTILPPQVRFDTKLLANAKLLYGEIKALCDQQGYCWASNHYFARLYSVEKKAVSRWIAQLEEQQHVCLAISKSQGNQRKIYLTDYLLKSPDYPPKGKALTSQKGRGTPSPEDRYPPKKESQSPSLLIDKYIDNNDRIDTMSSQKGIVNWEDRQEALASVMEREPEAKEVLAPHPPGGAPPPAPKSETMQTTSQIPGKEGISAQPFIPPTLPEVEAYMRTQSKLCTTYQIAKEQAQRFVNHYQSNGWRVGRNPMQDWQAAANNWLLNMNTFHSPKPKHHETHSRLHTGGKKDYSIPL